MPWLNSARTWWILTALWVATAFTLSSISGQDLPPGPEVPNFDKLAHAILYAGGAFCLATAWRLTRPPSQSGLRLFYLGCVLQMALIGMLDEAWQLRTPGRTGADPQDWLADLAGASLMCGILALISARKASRTGSTSR